MARSSWWCATAAIGFLLVACTTSTSPIRDAGSDGDGDAELDADGRSDADVEVQRDADDPGQDSDVETETDAVSDAELDGDADGVPPPARPRGGVIVLTEGFSAEDAVESSATARFFFRRHPSWCGYGLEMHGDCYIFRPNRPVCDPECAEDEVCVWNPVCTEALCTEPVDPATVFDPGDVTVTGATYQPLVTCAFSEEGYECDVDEVSDFWEAGDVLSTAAPGGTFPSFRIEFAAPAPLVVTTDTSGWTASTFDGSADVPVAWDATDPGTAIEISLSTDTASMTCLTRDTGAFVVPAEVLEAFGGASGAEVTVIRSNAGIDNEAEDGEVKAYAESIGLSLTLL